MEMLARPDTVGLEVLVLAIPAGGAPVSMGYNSA